MSWMPGADPALDLDCPEAVQMVIIPRTGDIGNFEVRRALPFREKRMVGPFIFWDQMGPGAFAAGQGLDVRPHPHCGLSTVTYLFEGSMDHRDSLGTSMRIQPGDVNLMTAGAGIVHSERSGADVRQAPSRLFGIQSWLAQPKSQEDGAPAFSHTPKAALPTFAEDGVTGRLILGAFGGLRSPVATQWESLYLDLALQQGARFEMPADVEERALYLAAGEVEIAGARYEPQQMLVLKPGARLAVQAAGPARLLLLGGAAMDGPRYIWWNFVASDKERIRQAALRWREGGYPPVPGDEEFIPLPDLAQLDNVSA